MGVTANDLANRIGATCRGDGEQVIERCATLEEADPAALSFLANGKYAKQVSASQAGAVVLSEADAERITDRTVLIADDPYYVFRNAVIELHGFRDQPGPGISEKAVIAATAELGEDCSIAPFVVIEDGAQLGDRCVVYPHCHVGENARLGDDCILHPCVSVYDHCELGDRVTLHHGCSIGQDGFGYATYQGTHNKIPQTGRAVIESDVEMGAGCTVDRATLGETRIGQGTKFSNGVTIGHGSKVGRYNLFVAQVGLAGSVKTGDYVALGGQVGVAGHLTIGEQAQVAGHSGVMNDVPAGSTYGGAPAGPLKQLFRLHAQLKKLPELTTKLNQAQKRIAELENKLGK
jgi:UDP-3-O-[3-hydroxymyristoyl] glucosamine N-acyltransferase